MKHLLPFLAAISGAFADDYNHRYKEGDRVDLWANKVSSTSFSILHNNYHTKKKKT